MIAGRLLEQFIAVAEELHFGRAAARLHMAQPPLSQAIKHLEELVGVQLLTRSKHFVALTPAGAAFLEESRELLAHGQRAIETARRASEGLTGRIAIGFVGSVSYELMPRILRQFRTKFPSIHVDLWELPSNEQVEGLLSRKIDLGIVRLPLNNAPDIEIRYVSFSGSLSIAFAPTVPSSWTHIELRASETFTWYDPPSVARRNRAAIMPAAAK
jgi:DNA-binding transcriptional LysR family regulator